MQLDDETSEAVREIVRRVDGVPLAIELAAARVRTTPPQMLLPKLRQALDVLTGGARDLPARQRTMRAAIAWSHDTLDDSSRLVFRRMAVLAGGGTADAIARLAELATDDAESIVLELVDRSLLREQTDLAHQTRYNMLRPVAAFASELLAQAGERDDVARRHADYFEALVLESESLVTAADLARFDVIEAEQANIAAAVDHLRDEGELARALHMAAILWRFWEARGYAREGLERMRSLLDDPRLDVPVKLHLSALYGAGILADSIGEYELGKHLFERHLALTETLGEPRATAVARNNLGIVLLRQGDVDAAIPHIEAATNALRELDPRGSAVGLANVGNAERMRRNFPAARARYEEALAALEDAGDLVNVAWTLSHLGDLSRDEANAEAARRHYDDSLSIFAELHHQRGMSALMTAIGDLAAESGQVDQARTFLQEALAHAAESGDVRGILRVFEVLAGVATMMQDDVRGLRLAAAVEAQRAEMGASLSAAERERLQRRVAASVTRLGEEDSHRAWREGTAMTMQEAVAFASAAGAI